MVKKKKYSQKEIIDLNPKKSEKLSCNERSRIINQMKKTKSYKEASKKRNELLQSEKKGCNIKDQLGKLLKTKKFRLTSKVNYLEIENNLKGCKK